MFKKLLLILLAIFLFSSIFTTQTFAASGINNQISFQGKVVNSDGTNVSDADYDFVFKIFDVDTAGSAIWTETRTSGNQVTVTNGIFQVNLGSVQSLPGSVDFNSDSLYLEVTFNGEVMSPRIRLTAVPYAMNAKKVGGLTVTDTTGTLTIPNGVTLALSGANNVTFTSSGATNVTLPTTGTLATLAGTETFSNKTIASGGLTVATSGWIGIGGSAGRLVFTDSTTDKVEVTGGQFQVNTNGEAVLVGDGTNTSAFINIQATRTQIGYDGSFGVLQSGTSKGLKFNVNASSFGQGTAMTIDSAGSVGIGDTTPDAKLEILSTTEQLRLSYTDNSVDSRFTVDSAGVLTIDNTGTKTVIADGLDVTGAITSNSFDRSSAGGLTFGGTNASSITMGSSSNTSFTLSTDSTGDGEVVLPNDSIGVAEINDTGDTPGDEECLTYESTSTKFEWQSCGSVGGTTWDAIEDAAGNGAIAMGATVQTIDWDTASGTGALDAFTLTFQNDITTDASTQRAFLIQNKDDGGATGLTEALLVIDNADANEAVTSGLLITSSGSGGITKGIDINDTDIVTDISFQNGETIHNNTDGVLAVTSPSTTFSGGLVVTQTAGIGIDVNSSISSGTTSLYGLKFSAVHGSTSSNGHTYGVSGQALINSSGGSSNAAGGFFEIQLSSNAPGWMDGAGLKSYAVTYKDGSTLSGLQTSVEKGNATGSLTNAMGLNITGISNAGTITNTYGIYIGDITNGTQTNTPFSLYASDSNTRSYIAGTMGIGTTTPDAKLESLATSGQQLRLTYTDSSVYSGFTVDSSGNLTIDNTGTKTVIADALEVTGAFNLDNLDRGTAGALTIGNTTATSVSICNSSACDTIQIGTNADADTISIGDSTDGLTIASSTFNVSSGAVSGITTLASSGDWTWTATTPSITINTDETFSIADAGGAFNFSVATGPNFTGDARPTKKITLSPEYSGATLTTFYGSGTDSSVTGTMNADVETTSADDLRTFYEWSSAQASLHSYTVAVRVTLPQDFSAWSTSNALVINYTTESTSTANNTVNAYVYLSSDTSAAVGSSTSLAASVAEAWTTSAIDDSTLDDGSGTEWDAAGETAVIYLRMQSKDNNFSRIGDITLNYLGKY